MVTSVGQHSFKINVAATLNNGDGLTFLNQDGHLQGTLLNRSDGNTIFPAKMDGIHLGMQIFRNADRKFLKQVDNSQPDRQIPIKLKFSETVTGFQLSAQDQDGNHAVVSLNNEKTPAHKSDQALKTLKRQLTRLGDSEFVGDELVIDLTEAYFLPVSTLNALRRDLVIKLREERAKNFPRLTGGVIKNKVPYPATKLDFLGNVLNTVLKPFTDGTASKRSNPPLKAGSIWGAER